MLENEHAQAGLLVILHSEFGIGAIMIDPQNGYIPARLNLIRRSGRSVMTTLRSIPLAVAASFIPASPVLAQDTLPAFRLINGQIDARFLPYGTRFKIRGPTQLGTGTADVVRGNLTPEEASSGRPQSFCWVRLEGVTGGDFELVTSEPLYLERTYEIKIDFLSRFTISDVQAALDATVDAMLDSLRRTGSRSFLASDVLPVWQEFAERELLKTGDGSELVTLNFDRLGQCPDGDPVDIISLSQDELNAIGRIVAASRSLEDFENRVDAARVSLTELTKRPRFLQLRGALTRAREADAFGGEPPYSEEDVDALFNALDTEELVPEEVAERFRGFLAHEKITEALPEVDSRHLLRDILSRSNNLKKEIGDRDQRRTRLDSLRADFRIEPRSAYVLQTSAVIRNFAWTDTTRVRALQIGTAWAFGLAGLSIGGDSQAVPPKGDFEVEPLFLLLFKFRLAPVDKRVPDRFAFADPLSRWSIDVGALFLDKLNYRGQPQEDLFGGLSPAVGVSWDYNSFVGIHVGVTFFRQPSVNPLNIDRNSGLRAAPYIALGFDFDIFNQIKRLTKS